MEDSNDLNLKNRIESLLIELDRLKSGCRDYKSTVGQLGNEHASFEAGVESKIHDTPKSFGPQVAELFADLRAEIINQKRYNEYLQKQITSLKKESCLIAQNLIANNTSVDILQNTIGMPSRLFK